MECPECKTEIGRANYCGCGWSGRTKPKNDDDEKPKVQCSHAGCEALSKVKIVTETGWANLCLMHYGDYYTRKANNTCNVLGLYTNKQRREYAVDLLRKSPLLQGAERMIQREPGEDWNEPVTP